MRSVGSLGYRSGRRRGEIGSPPCACAPSRPRRRPRGHGQPPIAEASRLSLATCDGVCGEITFPKPSPRHPRAGPFGAEELLSRIRRTDDRARPERRHEGRPVAFLTTGRLNANRPIGWPDLPLGPSRTCFRLATELTHLTFKCFHRYLPQGLLEILNACRIARGVARPAPVCRASGRRFHKRGGVTKEGHRCRVRP
jgi:hypothetical protein